ncbi:MAG: hypothetical protein HYT15_04915 [Candidatus Magasanikbacteria bacterium]|nr:hypothetical protein [Candidatus Magasanikbacteria bacterium]
MAEKFRPDFLSATPDIQVGPLANDEYGEGYLVRVGNLEGLPEHVKEQVPNGFVLKEYKSFVANYGTGLMTGGGIFSLVPGPERNFVLSLKAAIENFARKNKRFPSEEEVRVEIVADSSFQDQFGGRAACKDLYYRTYTKAAEAELLRRHTVIKNYFAKSLPDLVVPTRIFIDNDVKVKEKRIYELQPRVEAVPFKKSEGAGVFDSETGRTMIGWDVGEAFIQRIKEKFPKKIPLFKKELITFIEQIKKMPSETGYLPYDCAHLSNLLFTENGLRLADTNAVIPIPSEPSEEEKEHIEIYMEHFNHDIKTLELLEARL